MWDKDFKVEGVDHIGIVTDGSEGLFSLLNDLLGFSLSGKEEIKDQKTEVSVFRASSKAETALELLEPMSEDSVIARYREKNKKGIHHIALKVKGIESAIAHLETNGVAMIDFTPRIGHGGCRIAFIHPKYTSGILVELVEK